jgi:hypothetical protein
VRLAPRPARRPLSVNLADVQPEYASASQPEVATSAKRPRLDVPVEPGLHPMDCDASQGQASSDTPINIARRPHKVLQVKVDPCAHLKITDDDIYRRFVPDEIADDDDDDDDEVREEEERKRKQATNSALVFWQVNSHLWTVTFDPTSSEFVDYHELLLRWNSDHVKGQFEHEDDTAWTEEPKAKKGDSDCDEEGSITEGQGTGVDPTHAYGQDYTFSTSNRIRQACQCRKICENRNRYVVAECTESNSLYACACFRQGDDRTRRSR